MHSRTPVIAYKHEGYEMFEEMIERVQTTTISRLLKGRIVRVPMPQPAQRPASRPEAQNAPANGSVSGINPSVAARAQEIAQQRAAEQSSNGEAAPSVQNNGGLTPSAATTSSAAQTRPANSGAPVIGAAPQSPAGLMTNIGGKQIPKVAPKSAKVGRNDPCPCGSGKKYKDCCYWKDHK